MSYSKRFERNLGFFSEAEQEKIQKSSVAVAGAGGDGGMLAVQLARLGFGEIRLADPDPFEIENMNRQAICTDETLQTNKAVAVGDYIQKINPELIVKTYDQGVTDDNVESFVEGVDLLIDETEYTLHAIGVTLARQARQKRIPNLTAFNIGFGAVVTTYHPDGPTLESRLGFGDEQDIDEIRSSEVALSRWLPYLPKYGDLAVLDKVSKQERPAPSIAPGVAIAAGTAATQAALNIIRGQNKRPDPIYAPNALVIDVMSAEAKVVRYNQRSHYKHLASLLFRNTLKLNPKTSY